MSASESRGSSPRFGSKETQYLGRYTHRIALTNNRLVNLSDTALRFRYKDYAAGNRRKVIALDRQEFISRYLLRVLPKGLMCIRHYGLLGDRGFARPYASY